VFDASYLESLEEYSRFASTVTVAQLSLLELQLRGLPTDSIATLRILYGSYESVDPTAEARASAGRWASNPSNSIYSMLRIYHYLTCDFRQSQLLYEFLVLGSRYALYLKYLWLRIRNNSIL
jgi:hypothetical protein